MPAFAGELRFAGRFAPFVPEPHLWKNLKLLRAGTLTRPLDIFEFFWHALPWMLLAVKAARMALSRHG